MDIQTKSVDETGLPVQNFAVLALQRKLFARSNIRFLFVNKQSLNYERSRTRPNLHIHYTTGILALSITSLRPTMPGQARPCW